MIPSLIDKQDNFEIVRDQIAAILATEVASQMALASTATKDPELWRLLIFTEASNAYEQYLNNTDIVTPIVNVWYDNIRFDESASNNFERQKGIATYNIDCYGRGVSKKDTEGSGHTPGDKEAAFECQRAIRLVRNILMAAEYRYLSLQGVVWSRWPQSITMFQPEIDANQAQKVIGARFALRVTFNELAPQVATEVLEQVFVDVKRLSDGQIIAEADYDYTI